MKAAFEKFEDDFLAFEKIENPRHERPDMCAFLLLHDLVPGFGDIVSCAEHDQIWLSVEIEDLSKVATEDHIRILAACGVFYDGDVESLSMYV